MYMINENTIFEFNNRHYLLKSRTLDKAVIVETKTNIEITVNENNCPPIFKMILNE